MATHNLIATVSSVTGEVFVRNSEGQLQQLKVGDQLNQGDVVIPSNGGSVELTMTDGSTMTLDQPVEVTLSQEMLAGEQPAAQDDAITDESVAAVLEALESGGDPIAVLPPPAAGAAADEGHDFIRLARIVEEITPNAFPGDALAATDDDLLSPDLLDQQNEAPFAEANNYDVTEEGSISGNIITDDTGSGIDSDPEGDSLSIASVNGQTLEFDAEGNAEVTVGDGILTINGDGTFNYEHNGEEPTETSFSYTVTDGNQESNTATVTLNVEPVNDPPEFRSGDDEPFGPPNVDSYDFGSLPENSTSGTHVGTVLADDADGDTLSYRFANGTQIDGVFTLDASTGVITLNQDIDDDDLGEFDLTVQVSDDDFDTVGDIASVSINLTNVNDPPEFRSGDDEPFGPPNVDSYDFGSLPENSTSGTHVGTVLADDADGDTLSYRFANGTQTDGVFTLDASTGVITLNQDIDDVDLGEFDLTVQVSDDDFDTVGDVASVSINLTNVNDPPTIDVTANDFIEGDESNIEGVVAGTYTTDDVDGDNLIVTFTEGTNSEGYYALDTDNNQVTLTQAGVDQVNSGGDLPPIDLTVTDDGDPNLTGRDADTPEVDSLVHLDMTDSGGTVYDEGLLPESENSATTIGSFTITAPDGLASVTIAGYTLLVADLLNATEIAPVEVFSNADEELVITGYDAGSGSIDYSYTLMQPVAHEQDSNQTTASFQITATDQDGSVSAPADLVITQIDDIPEVMVSDGMGLNGVGQIIGALNGDPSADTPQTFNWGDVTSSVNIYANDEPVNISTDESSRTVTGMLDDGTMVFSLTLTEDLSTYTYQQYMPIQTEATDVLIAENLSGGNSDSFRLSLAGDEADPIQTEFFGYEFDDDLGDMGEYARSTVNTSANNMGVGTGQDVDSDAGEMDQLFMSFDHNVTNMSIKVELTGGPTSTATFQYTVYSIQPSELESLGDDGFTYESLPDGGTTRTVTVSDEDTVEISAQDLGLDEFTFIVFEAVEGEYKLVPSELTVDYLTETQDFSLSAPFIVTDSDFDSAGDTIDIDIMGNQLSLIGDESDNALGGNEQDNSLTGGGGDDILTGGFGSDTFVWNLNDGGSVEDPAVDLITDFDDGLPAGGGDILDLSDLLDGGDLTEYLHFSSDGTDSVLHISSSGGFTGGDLDTTVVDQVIEFNGVDLVGDLTTQNDIIDNLLQSGNLITD